MAALTSALVLTACLVNFLRFQHYPLLKPEVGLVVLGIAALATLMAMIYQRMSLAGRSALEALLIMLAVDFGSSRLLFGLLAAAAALTIIVFIRRSLLPVVGTMAFFVLLLGVADIAQQKEAIGTRVAAETSPLADAPALVHIILDEHVGIEGLPRGNPRTPAMKAALKSFYQDRNFRLFGRAYSEHLWTADAIPHMLNFGGPKSAEARRYRRWVGPNPYFAQLERRGYRINVHQSGYLQYCIRQSVDSCTTYSASSLHPVATSLLSAGERAGLIGVRFTLRFTLAKMLVTEHFLPLRKRMRERGILLPDFGFELEARTGTMTALAAFDALIEDLADAHPGEAYFAHLLLPHFPHALTSDCRLRGTDSWVPLGSALPMHQREAAYFHQVRCATRKLDEALRSLAASPAGANAIVIVHGDHGSRIATVEPRVKIWASSASRMSSPVFPLFSRCVGQVWSQAMMERSFQCRRSSKRCPVPAFARFPDPETRPRNLR